MSLEKLLYMALCLVALEIVWLLIIRGRKAPWGYLRIGRDEFGQWYFRWSKD